MVSTITPHIDGVGRLMITNGGVHPPEFWAQVTAEHIAPINPDMVGSRRFMALALQARICEILTPHHETVHNDEANALVSDPEHCARCVNPEPYLDTAVAAVVDAAKGTEWEAHFAEPEVQAQIRFEIGRHFATVQDIAKKQHLAQEA